MSNALSIFNQLRPVTVGYDNIFDHFEKMFEDDFFKTPSVNYPPYNIVKTGENQYNVEVALACLLYTSPSPRDLSTSRMPSSA